MTEADRLFVLRCLHTRNDSELAALESDDDEVAASTLNTGVPQPPPPATVAAAVVSTLDDDDVELTVRGAAALRCSYVVVHEESGSPIKSVRIGASVRHEWRCEGARDDQCLLVTSCWIKTIDSQHELIDEYGCSKDRNLVAPLEYTSSVC